jgi:hypothetical protein
MAKKIKIDKEFYDKCCDMISNQRIVDRLIAENKDLKDKVYEYMTSYMNVLDNKIKLFEENQILKELLNKEQDTQVIKYQGKLYRITSNVHYSELGEADYLQICATSYGEVNEDGKSEV